MVIHDLELILIRLHRNSTGFSPNSIDHRNTTNATVSADFGPFHRCSAIVVLEFQWFHLGQHVHGNSNWSLFVHSLRCCHAVNLSAPLLSVCIMKMHFFAFHSMINSVDYYYSSGSACFVHLWLCKENTNLLAKQKLSVVVVLNAKNEWKGPGNKHSLIRIDFCTFSTFQVLCHILVDHKILLGILKPKYFDLDFFVINAWASISLLPFNKKIKWIFACMTQFNPVYIILLCCQISDKSD